MDLRYLTAIDTSNGYAIALNTVSQKQTTGYLEPLTISNKKAQYHLGESTVIYL